MHFLLMLQADPYAMKVEPVIFFEISTLAPVLSSFPQHMSSAYSLTVKDRIGFLKPFRAVVNCCHIWNGHIGCFHFNLLLETFSCGCKLLLCLEWAHRDAFI